jgi:16S rRNA processing protein RimM
VKLGRICGVHGIKGWVKVYSYTEPRDNIVRFDAWILEQGGEHRVVQLEHGDGHGKHVLAKLCGVHDRNAAQALVGAEIYVERAKLPPCGPGEYYWVDLEGLAVQNPEGERLGRVKHLLATGTHDVLVLDGEEERLIPFVMGDVVRSVDIEAGVIVVDWDSSYREQ